MFVDFKNVDDANLALATIHGHPFAKHTFKVNRFSDIEKYAELDETTYVEPEIEEYNPRVWLWFLIYSVYSNFCRRHQEHLRAWLADPQVRDQYVTYRGDEALINWHGKPSQCEIAHTPVCFSPLLVCGQFLMLL
jgi:translation initiation factor 3 subunit B